LPPQVNENSKEKETEFKEVPIEEDTNTLTQKLIKNQKKEENNSLIVSNEEETKENTENENIEENKPVKKEIPKTTKPKEVVKKAVSLKKTPSTKESKIKYYVQVAALIKYKKPNKKFLNLIKKEGFNYNIYNTYIIKNNQKIPVTKILIGPFKNEKTARENLRVVKQKITQNAFIFKAK
jgi:DedD protein